MFAASRNVELKDIEALCQQAGSDAGADRAEKIVKQIAEQEAD